MFYLLAFVLNVGNLNPVVVKNCVSVTKVDARAAAKSAADDLGKLGLVCDQIPESLVSDCGNQKVGLVGKVLVMKSIDECKALPDLISKNLKNLVNRN